MTQPNLDCILLIDDDEATNFVHEWVIRQAGVATHVEVCQSAFDGLEYIQAIKPAVSEDAPQPGIIFLDINMPGMNGWEFLEKYEALPQDKKAQILVVMLTTSLNPDDRKRAESMADINCFMSKPLTEEMVKKLIEDNYVKKSA